MDRAGSTISANIETLTKSLLFGLQNRGISSRKFSLVVIGAYSVPPGGGQSHVANLDFDKSAPQPDDDGRIMR